MTNATRYLCLASMSFMLGCDTRTAQVSTPNEDVLIQGETNWMTLKDLRAQAESHLRSQYPDFNPAGAGYTASIYRNGSNDMLTIQYFRGLGAPVQYVTFDGRGQITYFTNRIATEGVQE